MTSVDIGTVWRVESAMELQARLCAASAQGDVLCLSGSRDSPERRLRYCAKLPAPQIDVANQLLDAPAGMSLAALGRFCREQDHHFPLQRPVPSLNLQCACAALPIFVEAFVASADLLTVEGEELSTPRAPRSAQGPDMLGGLVSAPPLSVAVRLRIRVFPRSRSEAWEEVFQDESQMAHRLVELMREAWACSVEGEGRRIRVIGAPNRRPSPPQVPPPALGSLRRAPWGTGRMLTPGDHSAIEAALEVGSRVVGAPFMGRIGTLEPGRAEVRLFGNARAASKMAERMEEVARGR